MSRRGLTVLQLTLMRWLDMLGSVRKRPVEMWLTWGGRVTKDVVPCLILPGTLGMDSRERNFEPQVKALRSRGLVRTRRGAVELTAEGSRLLREVSRAP